MIPGSEEGLQDQLCETLLMGQVKSSCKLPCGLSTVEVTGDLNNSSSVGSSGFV